MIPLVSRRQCVGVEILKDPPPRIWSTYADDVDPYAGTKVAQSSLLALLVQQYKYRTNTFVEHLRRR